MPSFIFLQHGTIFSHTIYGLEYHHSFLFLVHESDRRYSIVETRLLDSEKPTGRYENFASGGVNEWAKRT